MRDGCERVDDATDPPPRVLLVARTERSPGFGPSLAFPVAQWRRERRVGLIEAVPVTVAGPHRCYTGFRASPFAYFSCVARSRLRGRPPGRKYVRQLCSEPRSVRHVAGPHVGRDLRLTARVLGVERRECVEQPLRRARCARGSS